MNPERLLTWQYYFTIKPDPEFRYTTYTLILIGILLISSIAVHYYRQKECKDRIAKKLLKTIPSGLFNFGVTLILLWLFRETGLPYLSMRLWWFLFAIVFVVWIFKKIRFYRTNYQLKMNKLKNQSTKNKYLPKKKKRK